MKCENLKKKYGLSDEQIIDGIDTLVKGLGNICDINVAFALADLLAYGDIKSKEQNNETT